MLDVRRRIATSMVDALLADLDRANELTEPIDQRKDRRDRWREILIAHFVSQEIPFPAPGIVCSEPAVIEAFLVKYPEVRPLAEKACLLAMTMLPAGFVLHKEVSSDPETCGVCTERQLLALRFDLTERNDDLEQAFEDAWMEESIKPENNEVSSLLIVQAYSQW